MVALRVIKVEPACRVGLWHNVVLAIIHGHMDADDVRRLGESYDSHIAAHPEGIAAVTVLRGSLSVGSKQTNAEAQRMMARLRTNMLQIAIVIENHGFVAQLLRSVIRTLNSIGRGTRLSIVTAASDAARVIAPHVVSEDISAMQELQQELLHAIDELNSAT